MISPYSAYSPVSPMAYSPQPMGGFHPGFGPMIPPPPALLPGLLGGLGNANTACGPSPMTPPNSAVNIQVYANTPGTQPGGSQTNPLAPLGALSPYGQGIPGSVQQVAQEVYQRALLSQLQAQRDMGLYGGLMNQLQGMSAYSPYGQMAGMGAYGNLYSNPYAQTGMGAMNPSAQASPYGQIGASPYDPYGAQMAGMGGAYGNPYGQSQMGAYNPYDPYGQMGGMNPYDPYGGMMGQMGQQGGGNPMASLPSDQLVGLLSDPGSAGAALAEIGSRGRLDNMDGYNTIASMIQNPSDPNRVAALQALGQLNASQNSTLNRAQDIPGFAEAHKILLSKNESPDVKAAALGVVTPYYQLPQIHKMLKKALRHTRGNAQLHQQIMEAMAGTPPAIQPAGGGFSGYLA